MMKIKTILRMLPVAALAIATTFTSCSDNNSDKPDPDNNEGNLSEIVFNGNQREIYPS